MTHLLTSALAKHDPDWLHLGLERSYTRKLDGRTYVIVVDQTGPIAVYRWTGAKRRSLVRLNDWPPDLTAADAQEADQ